MKLNRMILSSLTCAITLALANLTASGATIKSGESVAFLGDSITEMGWGNSHGYVRLCEAAFKANELDVKIIPAGISGHKSDNMLKRVDGILARKPTYMTLSCGVNDVWHQNLDKDGNYRAGGVLLPEYKKNITEIVDRAQAAGVRVIILTATMITENPDNIRNKMLAPYNEFLRLLAKEKGCKLVDLNAEMQKQTADFHAVGGKGIYLTCDGVHMDFLGNRMMATMILKDGFDFSSAELAKSEEAIRKLPIKVQFQLEYYKPMTVERYLGFAEEGEKSGRGPATVMIDEMKRVGEATAKELVEKGGK